MTKSLRCLSWEIRKLPYYDGLADVDMFLYEFECEIPEDHNFQALELALHSTLARWWGTHKDSIARWRDYRRMMKLWFLRANTRMTEKYNGKDDMCDHLAKGTKAWGTKPQIEWVHIFCHTLDTIPMNWYLETELRHGTKEWDILQQGSLMTFSFEDGFECTNQALQEVKTLIFRIPQDPLDLIQLDWTT